MHFSLVLIGAHDGSKLETYIWSMVDRGNVLLVEPVPFLFEKLKERFAGCPSIRFRNCAVTMADGPVEFTAPKPSATSIVDWADQLGSLRPDHAVKHAKAMEGHVETIRAEGLTFHTLLRSEDVSSVEMLITDTEGMDAELLPTFPFARMVPRVIDFEFKHSDGVMQVGPKLANLLLLLDRHGYRVNVLDAENMRAKQPGA